MNLSELLERLWIGEREDTVVGTSRDSIPWSGICYFKVTEDKLKM